MSPDPEVIPTPGQGESPAPGPGPDDPPAFAEPWQARAFALMLKLREHGHFTAAEWSAALGEQLQHPTSFTTEPPPSTTLGTAPHDATHDAGSVDFYQHWLSALESLVLSKGLTDRQSLLERKHAWAEAYRHTPHGKPVELD